MFSTARDVFSTAGSLFTAARARFGIETADVVVVRRRFVADVGSFREFKWEVYNIEMGYY